MPRGLHYSDKALFALQSSRAWPEYIMAYSTSLERVVVGGINYAIY